MATFWELVQSLPTHEVVVGEFEGHPLTVEVHSVFGGERAPR